MRIDDHRRRAAASTLLLSSGTSAVLGATTDHALIGWLGALTTAIVAGGITISLIQRR